MNHIVTAEYLVQQGFSKTLVERFWKHVNKNGPLPAQCPELGRCFEWTGWRKRGQWQYGGFCRTYAHRVSWIIHFGPIPEGKFVLHKCDNPPCCNPLHLFLGTAKDNTHDMMYKGRMRVGNHSGEHNGNATVTWDIVRQIRARHVPWHVTKKQLANEFGCSFHVVKRIVENKCWIENQVQV